MIEACQQEISCRLMVAWTTIELPIPVKEGHKGIKVSQNGLANNDGTHFSPRKEA